MKAQGLAAVLPCTARCYRATRAGGKHSLSCDRYRKRTAEVVVRWLETVAGDAAVRHKVGQAVICANLERGGETGDHTADAAVAALLAAVRAS